MCRWPWVTFNAFNARMRGTHYFLVDSLGTLIYRLTYNDQIWHGNTCRGRSRGQPCPILSDMGSQYPTILGPPVRAWFSHSVPVDFNMMKLFGTTDINVIKDCQVYFGTQPPSEILTKRRCKFLEQYRNSCLCHYFAVSYCIDYCVYCKHIVSTVCTIIFFYFPTVYGE